MLIEWLWDDECFVNLKNMAHSALLVGYVTQIITMKNNTEANK